MAADLGTKQTLAGNVYLVRNMINGKCYVGCTKGTAEGRWKQHIQDASGGRGHYLHDAIRKYGKDNFTLEIVCVSEGERSDLYAVERAAIQTYNSMVPSGYNLTPGGDGVDYSVPEVRARHKAALDAWRKAHPEWMAQVHAARAKALEAVRQSRAARDAKLSADELEALERVREQWRRSELKRSRHLMPEPQLETANAVKRQRQAAIDAELPLEVLRSRQKDRARKKLPKKALEPNWKLEALASAHRVNAEGLALRDAALSPKMLEARHKQRAAGGRSRERRARGCTAMAERDALLSSAELRRRQKVRKYDRRRRQMKNGQV